MYNCAWCTSTYTFLCPTQSTRTMWIIVRLHGTSDTCTCRKHHILNYLWVYDLNITKNIGPIFHNNLKSIHSFSIQIVFTLFHAITWDHNITKAVQQRVNIHEKSYSKRQQELISESPSDFHFSVDFQKQSSWSVDFWLIND